MAPEDTIRNRKSYKEFKELLDFLNGEEYQLQSMNGNVEPLLMKFHQMLDRRGAYGSATNSEYATESYKLLAQDMMKVTP